MAHWRTYSKITPSHIMIQTALHNHENENMLLLYIPSHISEGVSISDYYSVVSVLRIY